MAQDLPVGMGMNLARTELIRNANKDFLIKLGNRTMEDMTYQGRWPWWWRRRGMDCSFGNIANIRQAMEAHCRPWERRGWLRYLEIWFEVSLSQDIALKQPKENTKTSFSKHTLFTEFFLVIQAFAPSSAEFLTALGPIKIYRRPKGPAPQVSWVAVAGEWTKGLTSFFSVACM